jgi:hypothetical protein
MHSIPLYDKWGNQEGSCAIRRWLPDYLGRCRPPEITIVIITSWIIQNYTQYRDSNNTKGNDGKTEKRGKPLSP